MNHEVDISVLVTKIAEVYDYPDSGEIKIDVRDPTLGGIWFLDVYRNNKCVNIEVRFKDYPNGQYTAEYGFTIIDEDVVPFTGPDCTFGYLPLLIKYLKIILP